MRTAFTERLGRLPAPRPDVEQFKTALRRGQPNGVPLIELAIADEVLSELDSPLPPWPVEQTARRLREWAEPRVRLWWRLGYDYYRVRIDVPFKADRLSAQDTAVSGESQRHWMNEQHGVIATHQDVERYPWPARADIQTAQAEAIIPCLPDGMGAIGFCGGVLEWASTLMGLEHFLVSLHDDPGLVRQVIDRVGGILLEAFQIMCKMDRVFAVWLGDDMGFKTATLLSPEHLRKYILPWHRRFATLAHQTGRFFLLHSCGHVEAIMPDLIRDVGIDAKHSFEDVITPVEQFKARWGHDVAVLGGVDVDLLARGSPDDVRRRALRILEACAPTGGYACGSGNSITNYVPAGNYLAMVETVHRFNGRL